MPPDEESGARPFRAAATPARQRRRRARASRGAAGHRRPRTGALLGGDRSGVANAEWWRSRRTRSTARSTSRSPGRSGSSPNASGRSTSTGSIRTSASSSRSSSRRCSSATCVRWAGPRPVRRLGHDARAGARVRLRRRRRRHRGVQRAPRLASRRASYDLDVARRGCARGGQRLGRRPRRPTGFVADVVRAAGGGRAAALPRR